MGMITRIVFGRPVEATFLVCNPTPIIEARIIEEPNGLGYWLIAVPTPVIDVITIYDERKFKTDTLRMGESIRRGGDLEVACIGALNFITTLSSRELRLNTLIDDELKPEEAINANLGLASKIIQAFPANRPRIVGTSYYGELASYEDH